MILVTSWTMFSVRSNSPLKKTQFSSWENVNGGPPTKHDLLTYFERLKCLFSTHEMLVSPFTLLPNRIFIFKIQFCQRSVRLPEPSLRLFRLPMLLNSLHYFTKTFLCTFLSENFVKSFQITIYSFLTWNYTFFFEEKASLANRTLPE